MLQWQRSALGPAHWIWEAAFLSLYVILGAGIGSLATKLPVADVGRAATRLVIAVAMLALAATRLSTEKISRPEPGLRSDPGVTGVSDARQPLLFRGPDLALLDVLPLGRRSPGPDTDQSWKTHPAEPYRFSNSLPERQ